MNKLQQEEIDLESKNAHNDKDEIFDVFIKIPNESRVIVCREHGTLKNYVTTVFFIPGMGFGRTTNLDFNNCLIRNKIRLIIIDRPGYGRSTYYKNRTYKSFGNDLYCILKYYKLHDTKSLFMAHSAGVPNLLGFCSQYPQLVQKIAIVGPPNPLHGKAPKDRPFEPTCDRKFKRFCVMNLLCCFTCCINPLLIKFEKDPKEFEKIAFDKLIIGEDVKFFEQYPEQKPLFVKHFEDAVHPPHGHLVLYQDFELATKNWGFAVRDVQCNVDVWFGDLDETSPNGKWFTEILPHASGYELKGYGHGLIGCKFDAIIEKLIQS